MSPDPAVPYADTRADVVRLHGGKGALTNLSPDRADDLAESLRAAAQEARGHIVATVPPQTVSKSALDELEAAAERVDAAEQQAKLAAALEAAEKAQQEAELERARLEDERGKVLTADEVRQIVADEVEAREKAKAEKSSKSKKES